MIIRILALWVMLAATCQAANLDRAPRTKHVELNEFTDLVVYVPRDVGVQFVFPFLLGEVNSDVPFNLIATNEQAFKRTPADIQQVGRRNNFVVQLNHVDMIGSHVGSIIMNVADSNITIKLISTSDQNKYYDRIVFDFKKSKRDYLISKALKARVSQAKPVQTNPSNIEAIADRIALKKISLLALQKPDKRRIRKKTKGKLDDGSRAELFLIDRQSYGKDFHIFTFELESHNLSALNISGVTLDVLTKGQQISVDASVEFPETVAAKGEATGVLVTSDERVLSAEHIVLSVATEKGRVEVKW